MIGDESTAALRVMADAMAAEAPVARAMLNRLLDDIEQAGPVARMIAGHPDLGEPLFCVRLLGGVSYLHETGRAPELSAQLDRLRPPVTAQDLDRTWELFREALFLHRETMAEAISRPVQQHHPSRAGVLLRGLAMLGASRVRLLELGACAGLNLLLDRYRWVGDGWEWGTPDSAVRLTAQGPAPGEIEIVDRAGCDLMPRDPADADDVAIVRSYLPYEQEAERREFDAAVAVAAASGLRIDRSDAISWLERRLSMPSDRSVTTVVWHSLFSGYLDPRQRDEIEELVNTAARRMPLARISYEPHRWSATPRLRIAAYV